MEYNYQGIDINKEISAFIESEYEGDRTIADVVAFCLKLGIIDTKKARNVLIKQFYYQQLKHGGASEAVLDCAANFDVSGMTVRRVVYSVV